MTLNFLKKATLKVKLLTLPLVLVIISFIILGVVIITLVTKAFNANEDNFISSKVDIFYENIMEEKEELKGQVKMVSIQQALYDGYFAYMAGDKEFIQGFVQDLVTINNVNEILLVKQDKTVLMRSGSDRNGDKLTYKMLDDVLSVSAIKDRREELSKVIKSDFVVDENGISIIAVGPIIDIETVVGAVVFIRRLDNNFISELKSVGMNKYEIQVANNSSVFASTLKEPALNSSIFSSKKDMYFDKFSMEGTPYKFAYKSLGEGLGFFGVGFDTSANASTKRTILLFNVIAIIISTLVIYILIYSVTKEILESIKDVASAAESIANHNLAIGDLPIKTDDEISALSKSLNKMKGTLTGFVKEIQKLSANVSAAAEEMSSSTEEISASCQGMSSDAGAQVNEVSKANEALKDLGELSNNIQNETFNSANIVRSMNSLAQEGHTAVKNSVQSIAEIEESSRKIQTIIDAIKEIASQTDLLALNAAIEAAKAGEQGKGFAVVAEEVRKLAEKSAVLTKEIIDLIAQSSEKVSKGVTVAKSAGVALEKITSSIKNMVTITEGVSKSIEDQNNKVQVVKNMSATLSDIAHKNSSATEEVSATTENLTSGANELAALASKLTEFIGNFKV